jgi:Fe-S oxidoreductase
MSDKAQVTEPRQGKKRKIWGKDMARRDLKVVDPIGPDDLFPLPPPYDKVEEQPGWKETLGGRQGQRRLLAWTGSPPPSSPSPKTPEEEQKYVDQFVEGLKKLLSRENNWEFLQPLTLSIEYCVGCQTCADACHVFLATNKKKEIYRPTYRSDVFRKLVKRYVKPGGKLLAPFTGADIDLNWDTITRLYELAYRCNLCRRCAQTCPIGVDNGLIAHEIRKLFSQELGWAPRELHEKGTVLQLEVGSSTGMNPVVVKDNVEFIDEDMQDVTGFSADSPFDKQGAEMLLIHNAGEMLAWPENPGAFAIILNAAGIDWTLSSDEVGYDGVNYGLFYDDVQLARIALTHTSIAEKLGVKKIIMGECGHQHKAMMTVADRVVGGDAVPRESALTLLEEIVFSGKIEFDPSKNDFPVTLHDPCNIVRNLGIVEPQTQDPALPVSAVPGDDAPRCGQLLLRGGKRLRRHVPLQLHGLAHQRGQPREVQADPGRVRRPAGARGEEVPVRTLFQLQGTAPGPAAVLRGPGEERDHLWRTGGAHRERHGGHQGALHPLGDALRR